MRFDATMRLDIPWTAIDLIEFRPERLLALLVFAKDTEEARKPEMEDRVGVEPTTRWLRASRSGH